VPEFVTIKVLREELPDLLFAVGVAIGRDKGGGTDALSVLAGQLIRAAQDATKRDRAPAAPTPAPPTADELMRRIMEGGEFSDELRRIFAGAGRSETLQPLAGHSAADLAEAFTRLSAQHPGTAPAPEFKGVPYPGPLAAEPPAGTGSRQDSPLPASPDYRPPLESLTYRSGEPPVPGPAAEPGPDVFRDGFHVVVR
jgi:hypothetical protein